MKTRFYICCLLLSLFGITSCSLDIDTDVVVDAPATFDFTLDATMGDFESDDDTKASVTSVIRLSWKADDEISVINLSTGKALGGSLVADKAGSNTTFSGTLTGTVRAGDKLAFLYPSQGYTEEVDYEPVTVDFSHQLGSVKDNVPICVYSTVTAGSGSSFSHASASFTFLMSYIQLSLANLEANALIDRITIENIGSSITINLNGNDLSAVPAIGDITLSPENYKTSSSGTKAIYLTIAASSKVSSRPVTVETANELKSMSWSGSALNQNTSYTSILASFEDAPIKFADANFKTYCVENFDTDGDGEISLAEARVVKIIDCAYKGIQSMDEIRYFTALTKLSCYYNQLSSLDVSTNTALDGLDCGRNKLTSLDVSSNTSLITLYCGMNQLTSLDVSSNTSLTHLSCGNNQLSSLDVSSNTSLTDLYCSNNQLSSLDVSSNTALTNLSCGNNQLTSLDVSSNTSLTDLYCSNNQLSSLDMSNNTSLLLLVCNNNQLTSLDVSSNTALETLYCENNQLTSLDVSNNTSLLLLVCNNNQLTSLDVSSNTALEILYCENNQLTSLDVSSNESLTILNCCGMTSLTTLYMKLGQEISGINISRSNDHIPDATEIVYIGDNDMEDGGEV